MARKACQNAPPHSWCRTTRRPCCKCPAQERGTCVGSLREEDGRGRAAAREGGARVLARKACKRTAAQIVQDGAPPVLYVPCEIARR